MKSSEALAPSVRAPEPPSSQAVAGLRLLAATATFRPYGTNLLAPAAAGWLLIVTVLVMIMATAEGVAWGRMMGALGSGPLGLLLGVFVGAAVFAIVWGIDATLMTLDMAAPSYERTMYDRKDNRALVRLNHLAGYLLRIGIVSGSLWLTAPQLADMMFSSDIEHHIDLKRKSLVDEARLGITDRAVAREEALRAQLWDDRKLLEDEIAGRSSGSRGNGPIARTIQTRIEANEVELEQIVASRTADLERLEAAVFGRDEAALQANWGLVLPGNSATERKRALDALSDDPSFVAAERSIQGFLLLIFVSLFALKLFQPRAVRVYLSGALQSEYERYLAGEFDAWLAEGERSTVDTQAMTAYRFEDLMLNTYPEVRRSDLEKRVRDVRRKQLAGQLAEIETVDGELQARLDAGRDREQLLHNQETDQLRVVEMGRAELDRLQQAERLASAALEEADMLSRRADPAEVVALARSKAILREELDRTRRQLHEGSTELRVHERGLQRTRREHDAVERDIEALELQLRQSSDAREAHRRESLRAVSRRSAGADLLSLPHVEDSLDGELDESQPTPSPFWRAM